MLTIQDGGFQSNVGSKMQLQYGYGKPGVVYDVVAIIVRIDSQ